MAAHPLDAEASGRLRDRINSDGAFGLVARDMTLNLAIEAGGDARLIEFRDGAVRSIDRFVPLTEPVDIIIKGTSEFWDKLLSPVPPPRFQNLYAAVRAETCQVSGNGELYAAYFAAITRLIDIIRDVHNNKPPRQ